MRIELLTEYPIAGKPLGRHIEHDPRSRDYPYTAPRTVLRKVVWARLGGVFDQGDLGSCTGNALAGALNTDPLADPARTYSEDDAVRLYSEATRLDRIPGRYPPDDTGSSGLAVCKAAKREGLIAGYTHAFSIVSALRALMDGPVITGLHWYEGFDTPDVNGVVRIAGQIRGGHEFEVVGYDPATRMVSAYNSWGTSWGLNGMFFFSAAVWHLLLTERGDVTIPHR